MASQLLSVFLADPDRSLWSPLSWGPRTWRLAFFGRSTDLGQQRLLLRSSGLSWFAVTTLDYYASNWRRRYYHYSGQTLTDLLSTGILQAHFKNSGLSLSPYRRQLVLTGLWAW